MQRTTLQKITYGTLTAGALIVSQNVLAHSNLVTRTVEEGQTIYNNVAIGHGCGSEDGALPVIANSVVFPDGTDSPVYINGKFVKGASVLNYIEDMPAIKNVVSKDVFRLSAVAHDRTGDPIGVHSWMGSLPAHDTIGLVPMRIGGVTFVEGSCAKSVTFNVAVADICKVTKVAGFADPTAVNFWTPKAGSMFDRADGENEATSLTITRTSALKKACGKGVDVVVTPSAAQLNHDMPIPGYWPKK